MPSISGYVSDLRNKAAVPLWFLVSMPSISGYVSDGASDGNIAGNGSCFNALNIGLCVGHMFALYAVVRVGFQCPQYRAMCRTLRWRLTMLVIGFNALNIGLCVGPTSTALRAEMR